MKHSIFLLLLVFSVNAYAQNVSSEKDTITIRTYSDKHVLIKEENYLDFKRKILHGFVTEFYQNGEIKSRTNYKNGIRDGEHTTYWENGLIKRKDIFSAGKIINGTCFDSLGKVTTYYPFRVAPLLLGGDNFVLKNLKYPREAIEKGISGIVYTSFTVDKFGTPKDFKIIKSPHPLLSDEALRVLKQLPKCTPGQEDNAPVDMEYNLPINFNL